MKRTWFKTISLAVSGFVLLAACGVPTVTTLPDGTVAYLIPCDSTAGGMNYCFERAGKSCGAAGYTIVDEDGLVLSESDVADSDSNAWVAAYLTEQDSILVKCGD